jgi:SSS family solute:Na+ symporter
MSVHLVVLLAYSACLVLLGIWFGRSVRGAGDFFVATRRLGPGLIFSTVLAANIGAGSTVGATGLAYQHGLSAWWWNGSAGLGSLLLALWIGPRIWRLASRHNFYTVGDFIEYRYGPGARAAVALLLWFGTLAILAGQLIGLAWILNVVLGLPKTAGCALGGTLITIYFAAGGLMTSARVNVVQLVVKLVGFAVAFPILLVSAGGLPQVLAAAPDVPAYGAFWGGAQSVSLLVLLVPAFIVSPGLLQKGYGARDERALRRGIGLNAIALMAFGFVPAILGMAARARYPHLPSAELALPTLLAHDLPVWVGALALAAVFSAELSAADAVLFMLSTSLSQDLYRRFLKPAASDRDLLPIARGAAVAGGTLGILLAIVSPSIIAALSIFYALLGVSLFVPVIAGLHLRRTRPVHALAPIAAGIPVFLFVHFTTGGRGYGIWTPALIGIMVAAVAFALVCLLPRRSETTGRTGSTGV